VNRLRELSAEFIGSAFLTAIVIGSGIAAQQLSPNQIGLELLENTAATVAGLYILINVFGPIFWIYTNCSQLCVSALTKAHRLIVSNLYLYALTAEA
jgi:glycerol uptake facilitator-like aquaporin